MNQLTTVPRRDQATELRALLNASIRDQHEFEIPKTQNCRMITIGSGKGGVGKSIISLNMAIAIAERGHRVCLWDADSGLGNLSLLSGLNSYWNFEHVQAGFKSLADITLDGPSGIQILPGIHQLCEQTRTNLNPTLMEEFYQFHEQFDYVIVDCMTGIHRQTRLFMELADLLILISTRETTSLAETYSLLKQSQALNVDKINLILNRTETNQAQTAITNLTKTAKLYLRDHVSVLDCLPEDQTVTRSVAKRTPFVTETTDSSASQTVRNIARLITSKLSQSDKSHSHWMQRLNESLSIQIR